MHPQVSKLSLVLHLKFAVICNEFIGKCCAFLPPIGGIFECTSKFYNISYRTSVFYTALMWVFWVILFTLCIILYIMEAKFSKISQKNFILCICACVLLLCVVTFLSTLQMPSNGVNELNEESFEC